MPFLYLTEIFLAICFGWIVATQIVYPIINGRSLFPILHRETSNRLARAKDTVENENLERQIRIEEATASKIHNTNRRKDRDASNTNDHNE